MPVSVLYPRSAVLLTVISPSLETLLRLLRRVLNPRLDVRSQSPQQRAKPSVECQGLLCVYVFLHLPSVRDW